MPSVINESETATLMIPNITKQDYQREISESLYSLENFERISFDRIQSRIESHREYCALLEVRLGVLKDKINNLDAQSLLTFPESYPCLKFKESRRYEDTIFPKELVHQCQVSLEYQMSQLKFLQFPANMKRNTDSLCIPDFENKTIRNFLANSEENEEVSRDDSELNQTESSSSDFYFSSDEEVHDEISHDKIQTPPAPPPLPITSSPKALVNISVVPEKSGKNPAKKDSRSNLLESIRKGTTLNKVGDRPRKASTNEDETSNDLMASLTKQLQLRRKNIRPNVRLVLHEQRNKFYFTY